MIWYAKIEIKNFFFSNRLILIVKLASEPYKFINYNFSFLFQFLF